MEPEQGLSAFEFNAHNLERIGQSFPSAMTAGDYMGTTSLVPRKRFSRFSLRRLLLLFIPLSIVLSVYGHVELQKQRAINAWNEITSKGVDSHVSNVGMEHTMSFKNGNVSDDDLDAFIPAFNGCAPKGFGKIIRMELCGSKVSNAAIERFHRAVPDCQIVR